VPVLKINLKRIGFEGISQTELINDGVREHGYELSRYKTKNT
jgi:hypothetical protein